MANLLRNGDFERGWEGTHHRCVVYPVEGAPYEREAGEIACPEGWMVWYLHGLPVGHDPQNGVGWAAPEVRPCGLVPDPARVRSGQFGCLVFTFSRIHDAGLFQQVNVTPGTRLRLSAYAHAWSSGGWGDSNVDNPRYSAGAGTNPFYAEEGTPGLSDDLRNFTFQIGIDPTGGTDPYAPTVVWGKGAHIYNAYHQVPAVETVAQSDRVTVFLRSRCLWPFKHNDAYWDDVVLEVVEGEPQQPPSGRGAPREQYERTYVLLPQNSAAEMRAMIAAVAARREWTVGSSADDAGIGDLDARRVIAVNPESWPGDLEAFFNQYYPGVGYRAIAAPKPILAALALTKTDAPLDLRLSQRDDRWADVPLGPGPETIGQSGCLLTAFAIGLRALGYDILPHELNILFTLARAFNGQLLPVERVGAALGWQALRENGATSQRISSLLSDGWIVIAVRSDGGHFFYVRRAGRNSLTVIDPWDGREKTVDISSIGGIRALKPGGQTSPVPTPPPATIPDYGLPDRPILTLHCQTLEPGWQEFLRVARPRSVKVFDASAIRAVRQAGFDGYIVWRPYTNDHDQMVLLAMNPSEAARQYVERVLRELGDAPREKLFVEGLNETVDSGKPDDYIRRVVEFECQVARMLSGHNLRAVMLNVPVGNMEAHHAAGVMLELARTAVQTGSAIGYHNYWWANPQQSGLESWWPWHAGRALEIWDAEFRKRGLYPLYFFGETGACGSTDGYCLDPGGGWRHPGCYDGNWGRYLADLLLLERKMREWEAQWGRRILGAAIFTINPGNWGWDYFLLREGEMNSLASALA